MVPWEAVRTLAGFPPEPKQYYLPRSLIKPPEELRKQVFPLIEQSLNQIATYLTNDSSHTEFAGISFLGLMDYLRDVILQDAALMLNDVLYFNKDS